MIVVTMFTVAMCARKDMLDKIWRVFDVFSMGIDLVQKKPKHDAILPDVNSRGDLFAFDTGLGIDNHVPAPAIATANRAAVIIAQSAYRLVESDNECLVRLGNKVESLFLHQFFHIT